HPKSFPIEDIFRISQSVLLNEGEQALQYGTTEGYIELRKFLAARERSVGVQVDEESILITSGSQQGLELVSKTFLDKGDTVLVEEPSYLGGLSAFRLFQASFETVPLEDDGPDLDALRHLLDTLPTPPKFFYIIPTFQNPSGITYSLEKRKELAEMAREYDLLLVEDNPYAKLRFEGDDIPSVKVFAPDHTIYLSSFSKILSPGFRLAWICAPKDVVRKLVIVKQATDLCSNSYVQLITYQLLRRGLIDRHIPWIATMYKEKRDIMLKALEEYFPPEVTWTHPEGGMFLWVTLPDYIDAKEMFADAIKQNVAYVQGGAFFVSGGYNHMRLTYVYVDNDKIRDGIRRLAAVIKDHLRD
ncbi:MAG TPA: PLP-dependent aminotransferase family protein, partial [Methanomicrobia archaeon]|nr:PLP-dependent aminotransferase family protein [Methanomicrobia archaeon]